MSAVEGDAALQTIWREHRPTVLDGIATIERALGRLEAGRLGEQERAVAQREAHKLAGAVGTFGFERASDRARHLESALAAPSPVDAAGLRAVAGALRGDLDRDMSEPMPVARPLAEGSPLLLLVEDDADLAERLAAAGEAQGMRTRVALTPRDARAAAVEERPDAALLDLRFGAGPELALDLLGDLSEHSIPVLVFTASDDFADRVEAARRGAQGYLRKSMRPDEAVAAVTGLLERMRSSDIRLLAVDDDPTVLAALRALLEPEGLALTTLDDPARLWQTLEESVPDLLILDVDMPDVSGVELCRVVRNDPRWASLPIVFLTARRDPVTVQEVFAAGADDYLNKPIIGTELTVRIRNRLERIRLYRALAERDALTGVANRGKSVEAIGQLTRMAERYGQPLCFAELDIDHFKQVNDRHGHAAGDAVLRRLGDVLRRTFRGDDVIGRWGGEEFVVAMYGLSRADGVERLTDALDALREEDLSTEGIEEAITFSGGVAQYPDDGDDARSLYRAADAALYRAKQEGRDRVLAAGATTRPAPPARSAAAGARTGSLPA